jgi:hypothetical protein
VPNRSDIAYELLTFSAWFAVIVLIEYKWKQIKCSKYKPIFIAKLYKAFIGTSFYGALHILAIMNISEIINPTELCIL